jgi:hypothetical protein
MGRIIFKLQALVLQFAMDLYIKRPQFWHEIILLEKKKRMKMNASRNCKYDMFFNTKLHTEL